MDKNDVVCIKPEKMEVLDVVGILINPNTPVNLPHYWKKFFPSGASASDLGRGGSESCFHYKAIFTNLGTVPTPREEDISCGRPRTSESR